MDRAYRIGQKREVDVYRLIGAGTCVKRARSLDRERADLEATTGSKNSSTTGSNTSARSLPSHVSSLSVPRGADLPRTDEIFSSCRRRERGASSLHGSSRRRERERGRALRREEHVPYAGSPLACESSPSVSCLRCARSSLTDFANRRRCPSTEPTWPRSSSRSRIPTCSIATTTSSSSPTTQIPRTS